VARGGKTYGPTAGGSYRRGPRHYVPDAMGHDDRCIVLQNFGKTIYFCKIEIEKIQKKFDKTSNLPLDFFKKMTFNV
jgi:hypothetical protein